MEGSLCTKCQTFVGDMSRMVEVAKEAFDAPTHQHHEFLFCLKEAAANGCFLCLLFMYQRETLLEEKEHSPKAILINDVAWTKAFLSLGVPRKHPELPWILSLWPTFSPILSRCFEEQPLILELHQLDSSSQPIMPIESSTGSISAIRLMKSWLRYCMYNGHSKCLPAQTGTPTRLLFVDESEIRLIHTSTIANQPLYFTLSHCWGTIDILKLTRENIDDMQREIRETELCQTFRDAINVTRMLGFSYIWIDSLCIIQDDVEDWRKEASRMSDVYGGSTLNLAASGAQDGSVGLFFDRNEKTMQRLCRYQITNPSDGKRRDCLDPTIYRTCVEQSPLAKRGWAFQERFLSPRTLHFTGLQLYWECRERMASETYQQRQPPARFNLSLVRDNMATLWSDVIHHYSRCKLTREKDKLVALSGVARWLHDRSGDEYVAGLWRTHIEPQLIWRSDQSARFVDGRSERTSPSWSWAAVDGAVKMYHRNPTPGNNFAILSQVVDVNITYEGDDPLGEVNSGKIKLLTVPLIGMKVDSTEPTDQTRGKAYFLNGEIADFHLNYDFYRPRGLIYCLPVLSHWYHDIYDDIHDYIQGLVLEKVLSDDSSNVRGIFRRAGCFEAPIYQIEHALKESTYWASEGVYGDLAGKDKNGVPQYFLTIV